jgi:hypothetical protein
MARWRWPLCVLAILCSPPLLAAEEGRLQKAREAVRNKSAEDTGKCQGADEDCSCKGSDEDCSRAHDTVRNQAAGR